jgi:hypothetical protein
MILGLTKGYSTIVDDEEMYWIGRHKWKATVLKGGVYASRSVWNRWTQKHGLVLLHREIMHAIEGEEIDHRNGDKLDNRKTNLRYCHHLENSRNVYARRNNTSGVTGVYFRHGKWFARISSKELSPRIQHLGTFTEKKDAVAARDAAVLKYFGDFGVLSHDQRNQAV